MTVHCEIAVDLPQLSNVKILLLAVSSPIPKLTFLTSA